MRREFKDRPLSFDSSLLPDRYFSKLEWREIRRLIKADKMDRYEAVQKVFDARPITATIEPQDDALLEPTT